jgi:glycosyltransferase involved in cell wall biosynthesis
MTRSIALVTGDFVKTGGMDRANYALAEHLAERGDDVHLIAYRAGAELTARGNVTLHQVAKPLRSYSLGAPLLDAAGRNVARRITARGGRAVVNGGNCRFDDVNWVHHLNLLDTPKPGGSAWRRIKTHIDYRMYVRSERGALGVARRLVTTCEKNRLDLHRWFGIPPERIDTVYYGTDARVFHPVDPAERRGLRERLGLPVDRPLFAFVGALGDRRKGFDTLFTAWLELCRDRSWEADLVVVGAGGELEHWRTRAREEAIADRIRFLGFRRDVPDLFRACDAHVLPSRYEGYSLVTQEALCCGLPAFVTRVAGIAERYPAPLADALLIDDPDDVAELSRRLREWSRSEAALAVELSAFSTELRGYGWDDMARRFAVVLDRG